MPPGWDRIFNAVEKVDAYVYKFICAIRGIGGYHHTECRRRPATTFRNVAGFPTARESAPGDILGYYTLSATSITRTALPRALLKKLPRYRDMPATLLGRLAVATKTQGQGIGGRLLISAMTRACQAATEIASMALVTDPKDETASAFYENFGFRPLNATRLFLPMKEVDTILSVR